MRQACRETPTPTYLKAASASSLDILVVHHANGEARVRVMRMRHMPVSESAHAHARGDAGRGRASGKRQCPQFCPDWSESNEMVGMWLGAQHGKHGDLVKKPESDERRALPLPPVPGIVTKGLRAVSSSNDRKVDVPPSTPYSFYASFLHRMVKAVCVAGLNRGWIALHAESCRCVSPFAQPEFRRYSMQRWFASCSAEVACQTCRLRSNIINTGE
jgi:hypothetical protein